MEVATTFWSWPLGVTMTFELGNTKFLGPAGSDPLGDPVLCLQQVDEPRSRKPVRDPQEGCDEQPELHDFLPPLD
jgi:hypothetical protein